jgi:hypothetical protein
MREQYKHNPLYKSPFTTMYMPDLWGLKSNLDAGYVAYTTTLLLLQYWASNSYLYVPKTTNKIPLIDLIDYVCDNIENVQFLQQDDIFCAEQYVALWPNISTVTEEGKKLYDTIIRDLDNNGGSIVGQLNYLCRFLITSIRRKLSLEKLEQKIELLETLDHRIDQKIVDYVVESPYSCASVDAKVKVDVNLITQEFDRLTSAWNEQSKDNKAALSHHAMELNDFGNEISIVFQNAVPADNNNPQEKNILFTGDLPKDYMKLIRKKFWDTYDVIKIPHHGTKSEYYDFSSKHPKILLIPNGNRRATGNHKGNANGIDETVWISDKILQNMTNVQVYCSNCNCCKALKDNGTVSKTGTKIKTCACQAIKTKNGQKTMNHIYPRISKTITI